MNTSSNDISTQQLFESGIFFVRRRENLSTINYLHSRDGQPPTCIDTMILIMQFLWYHTKQAQTFVYNLSVHTFKYPRVNMLS